MSQAAPAKLADVVVLVVEDNKFMRGIIADLLRQVGFQRIVFACDGKEGIKQFTTWLPKIVFLDWNMPEMDGVAFAAWVRRSPESANPETPIVMISGNNQEQEIVRARDAGVNEFIAKPVTAALIQERLRSIFGEPRKFVRSSRYSGPCRRRRKNVDYKGQLRRLSDPVAPEPKAEADSSLLKAISADLAALGTVAQSFDVADRRQVRDVRDRTERARDSAIKANDAPLTGAADSLMGYIDAVGASGALDREVVLIHLAAMNRLIELNNQKANLRQQVVDGLKAAVDKRLRQAEALPLSR